MTSWLDRFKTSEFASVREHATMAEQEFKEAIVIHNDCLPEYLQTHDAYEMEDREGHHHTAADPNGGHFYGTDLATIERRMAARAAEQEDSQHVKDKREKESRIEEYAAQWDAEERIDYRDDEFRLHRNQLKFLRLVLSQEEWEDFEEEVEATL